MKFCYLKRERYGAKQRLMWFVIDAGTGKEITTVQLPFHRLKQDAEAQAHWLGYTVLPDGMTPEQYEYLLEFRRLNPHNWRKKLWTLWYTGLDDSHPLCRQLRNTLGPEGLAKFKF